MNLQIRPAAESDLDAIVALLERDSITGTPRAREDYLESFRRICEHPDNQTIVAAIEPEVVGTLQLTFIPGLTQEWRAQVENVRVREDLRSLGIGGKLMEWVIERARERGCRLVQLTTNVARADAQRFYRRLGFQPSHVGMKLYL
jgi:ribosomal protein S18 acetylase RimI-like enzyme